MAEPNVAGSTSYSPDSKLSLAKNYEVRPEPLFEDIVVPRVVDASMVKKKLVKGLWHYRLNEVYAGKPPIIFNLGLPNMAIYVQGKKLAAKSVKRGPTKVEDDVTMMQAGIQLIPVNLPEQAEERLTAAIQKLSGEYVWTCVNACATAMKDAGFSAVFGRDLTTIYFPYDMLCLLLRDGILYDGQRVEFAVVRTSNLDLEHFALSMVWAELCAPARHADLALEEKSKHSKFYAGVSGAVHFPANLIKSLLHRGSVNPMPKPVLAPALPPLVNGEDMYQDIDLSMSASSGVGVLLRLTWGRHSLFQVKQSRVNLDDYLSEKLQAFPQKNPGRVTRLKKKFFSKGTIEGILGVLAPRFIDLGSTNERQIFDEMRTHTEATSNKYNFVATGLFIRLSRCNVKSKIMDWFLSKHALMCGLSQDVRMAGEIWKDADGYIHVNNGSGTYKPTTEQLFAFVEFLKAVFPHLADRIIADPIVVPAVVS